MGRKTREKGSNYIPVDYSDLLNELNSSKRTKKGYKYKKTYTSSRRYNNGKNSCD